MNVGDIYRHERFYASRETGLLLPKYLVILALPAGSDIVARLLTSQYEGLRPEQPPCHHGDPYPGFYLGVLGDPLFKKSWIDLRRFDDLDADSFRNKMAKNIIVLVTALNPARLRAALECAANADDTTRQQERQMRDALGTIG